MYLTLPPPPFVLPGFEEECCDQDQDCHGQGSCTHGEGHQHTSHPHSETMFLSHLIPQNQETQCQGECPNCERDHCCQCVQAHPAGHRHSEIVVLIRGTTA